ncbi:MAG: hypothetical protein JO171_07725 [Paludibacterium sp.]|uniref:hypothetical protein n=1 Tax=Paludibacterium sp. TaxID=1917523 RepID=UPI0025F960AA|nr:hypothetical protein [Paludibacterium sp.]MBV8047023.1 hypothetical protein [Paludibacterium sp.]MBV8648177.1 hypothetical protein [Paludibacterium sp.]
MSASVFLACQNATNGVTNNTVRLTFDAPGPDTPRALAGMLILSKASVPLYAIRQQDPAPLDADSPA